MQDHIDLFFQDGTKDLTNISSCEQGCTMGNFWEGVTCPHCHTRVKTNFAEELKFRAWLEIPDFLPPVLHPVAFGILDNWLGSAKKAGKIMNILLDVRVPLPEEYVGVLGQGFRYFYENFDNIINFFASSKKFQSSLYREKTENVLKFIAKYRDRLFLRHIPTLNSSLHLLTKSGSMNYSDTIVQHIIRAKIELSQLIYVYLNSTYNNTFIDRRMFSMYSSFLEYTTSILNDKLLKKPGFIRKHLLGARLYCTARAVIVPITGAHEADEVYMPWLMAVQTLHLEIINVLMNRKGLTLPQAVARHRRAVAAFDPEIYEIINTLIEECPYKGLPCLIGRNPSLRIGAIFLLFATKVKPEYEDTTLSISPLISNAPNFDFDGDAMHILCIKEMGIVPELMKIHPANVLVASADSLISADVQITTQAAIALNGWLNDPDQFKE